MIEFAYKVIDAQSEVIYLVLGFCCVAAVIMREFTGSGGVAFALLPVSIGASLVIDYLARANSIFLSGDPTVDIFMACCLGTSLSVLVSFICYRLGLFIADLRVRHVIKRGRA